MRRDDCDVKLGGDLHSVRDEKRCEKQASGERYSDMQCAYGSFRLDVDLPTAVKADHTKATYRDGVLRTELTKSDSSRPRRILVSTT